MRIINGVIRIDVSGNAVKAIKSVSSELRKIANKPIIIALDATHSIEKMERQIDKALSKKRKIDIETNMKKSKKKDKNESSNSFSLQGAIKGFNFAALAESAISAVVSRFPKAQSLEENKWRIEDSMGIHDGKGNMSERNAYFKALDKQELDTVFTQEEVYSAGLTAIENNGGSSTGALEMIQVAQDMAANKGTSLESAIAVLVDAKNGKSEGVEEFGVSSKGSYRDILAELKTKYAGDAMAISALPVNQAKLASQNAENTIVATATKFLEDTAPAFKTIASFCTFFQGKEESNGPKDLRSDSGNAPYPLLQKPENSKITVPNSGPSGEVNKMGPHGQMREKVGGVTIGAVANKIVVNKEADIEKITTQLAKKLEVAMRNLAYAPGKA